ncbi:SDR family NAD(P)-dependent oxidoreductase [Nocardia crassostreae]|uniref:SDR family NAD(P)-dependent oxidoreductase n=1 Tax=Nocardia crassostreae TaxID=53428 RepID=UPI000830D855|nr:SDR family NAD(P)-dependent oxidoreductase [Nocardia crassostreae]
MCSHRLPDGSIPVLLSSDTAAGLRGEAVAILTYLETHPAVTPDRVSDMLFRTRIARRYRALIMIAERGEPVAEREELLDALRALAADRPHPAVVSGDEPATARKIGFVFPGQGSQRPGMGKLYYALSPAYRARVDECSAIHTERFGHDQPLHYLLGNDGKFQDEVWEVQPALMFHMSGLAAMWQATGVRPAATIGHSQGELAACATSEVMSLRDSVLVVTHRARLVERLSPLGYSMAVLAMSREDCEDLLARHSGWAELSVVNSPSIMAISGDRQTIKDMVATATERGQFAREIGVAYPAHTSIVAEVRADFEGFLGGEMSSPTFHPTEIPSYGAALGEAITPDLAQEQYWYWNLRNRVRFDRAVVSAATAGIDTLIEVVEHPVLQLALQENLNLVPRDPARGPRDFRVLGTSLRTADTLREFTRNLATIAVADLGYDWNALRTETSVSLPPRDFPHTVMNPRKLWAAAGYAEDKIRPAAPPIPPPQRLVESWVQWDRRSLTALRTLAVVDPTGRCADMAAALIKAADRYGATATILDSTDLTASVAVANPAASVSGAAADHSGPAEGAPGAAAAGSADSRPGAAVATRSSAAPGNGGAGRHSAAASGIAADSGSAAAAGLASAAGSAVAGSGAAAPGSDAGGAYDTVVILLPPLPQTDGAGAVPGLAGFFATQAWLEAVRGLRSGGECWLVTVGGESVVDSDPLPQLFHAAVSSGFRCVGVENPGVLFRHLDLAADAGAEQASRIVGALHTAGEPDLALRGGKVFVKRLVEDESEPGAAADLDHVVIVGGTGQLGRIFAEHFARTGAGRVTLLSRSGEAGAPAGELARLRSIGGTEIVAVACDVSDPESVRRFAAEQADRPASVLIHAAVNYVDAGIAEITPEMVATAAASKVVGLEAVLAAVPRTPDCRILLCSSMAATLGGRGQILYAVTNRMLDIVARRARAQGLACTSIEWALWSVAGPLDAAGFARVSGTGMYPMNPADAIAAGLTWQPTDAVVISADWPLLRANAEVFGQAAVLAAVPERPERVAPLRVETSAAAVESVVDAAPVAMPAPVAASMPPAVAPAADRSLAEQVLAELERVMGVGAGETIDRSVPLVALGLDSLQALDFRKRVRSALDRDLPVAAILGGASLDDVVLLMAENTN